MIHLRNAGKAWGSELPEWVAALAQRADEIGLKKTSAQVGYSASALSYVLNRKYQAPTDKIETAVRATLMSATIACPELGELQLVTCLEWRERAKDFQPTSSMRRRMLDACRTCPHNAKGA